VKGGDAPCWVCGTIGFIAKELTATTPPDRMQLMTILNRIQNHKSFVYGETHLYEERSRLCLDVELRPRANGRVRCSGCDRARSGYDTLAPRRFEFVPLWGIALYFVYAMRRVNCPTCGVGVESVSWGNGKNESTTAYAWVLALGEAAEWSEVAEAFQTSWDRVYGAVEMAVT